MICKVCGRMITNKEANFCEYCGASFRPGSDNKVSEEIIRDLSGTTQSGSDQMNGYTQPSYQQQPNTMSMPGSPVKASKVFGIFDSSDRPMTFWNWLIIYLLPFIPMIGTILFIVVLCSWAFGANVATTKKNWARATMVFVIIMIVMMAVMISGGYFGDPKALFESLYGTGSL